MDPRSLGIRELRARCQSTAPAPERETFTGWSARRFSIYFTKYVFLRLPNVTPNHITIISVLVFLTGAGLFLTSSQPLTLLGAGLVYFATVLDGCDGEVARFRKLRSQIGGVYSEPISHDVQYGLMFLPLGIAAARVTGNDLPLIFGFMASVCKLLTRLAETRYWMLKPESEKTDTARREVRQAYAQQAAWRRALSWVKRNTLSSNGMILPLAIAALFDRVDIYVYAYGSAYASLWLFILARQFLFISRMNEHVSGTVTPGSAD